MAAPWKWRSGRVAFHTAPCSLKRGWILRKFAYAGVDHPEGAGVYWDEHELEHPNRKALLSVPAWEWPERDGPALVWAEKGLDVLFPERIVHGLPLLG